MCLALPARVLSLDGDDMATVALEGVKRKISLALVEGVAPGDYVLVHVGFALHALSEEEAARTLETMAEAGLLAGELDEMAERET